MQEGENGAAHAAHAARGERPLPVAERFVSINGEGPRAGRLAAFIRFVGCDLSCSYCDTVWANDPDCPREHMGAGELAAWVAETGASCVTLTGGEPALQPGLPALVEALARSDAWGGEALGCAGNGFLEGRIVEIETNGAAPLAALDALRRRLAREGCAARVCFTMDRKMPSSGMAGRMCEENIELLGPHDAVKFVVGDARDLAEATRIVTERRLCDRCQVFFSPVFGAIDPADIVEQLRRNRLGRVRLQLQMHKIIWPDRERGC